MWLRTLLRLFASLFVVSRAQGFVAAALAFPLRRRAQIAPARPRGRLPPEQGVGDSANSLAKGLIIELCELEDVNAAPSVLAPHVGPLLDSDMARVQRELVTELTDAGLMTEEGQGSIDAAVDYVVYFLEEFTAMATTMVQRHQLLLKRIVEAAKDNPSSLDAVMSESRHEFDSTFLLFLRDEVLRLEQTQESNTLVALLRLVQARVRSEIEAMTDVDTGDFASLMEKGAVGGAEAQKQGLRELVANRSAFEARRFIGFVDALSREAPGEEGTGEVASLVSLIQEESESLFAPPTDPGGA